MKRFICMVLIISMSGIVSGCNNGVEREMTTEETSGEGETPLMENNNAERTSRGTDINSTADIEDVDYSDCYNGVNGCAVFSSMNEDKYIVYNEDMCNVQVSPFSTFKIPAGLIGLNNGVIASKSTTMGYSGGEYPFEAWNKDLTMEEAFKTSCVWYFRKVIDGIGKDNVQSELNELGYGNCDISQWEGSGESPTSDTNGFWLGSSLKISPMEQVDVMKKIFEGNTRYTGEQIGILKDVMYAEEINGVKVYGKTGTGRNGEAWFAGFIESENERNYFAVYLEDKNAEGVAGAMAKEITMDIINRYYS